MFHSCFETFHSRLLSWWAAIFQQLGCPTCLEVASWVRSANMSTHSRDLSLERGAARAEDAPGTSTRSHKSPSILAHGDKRALTRHSGGPTYLEMAYWVRSTNLSTLVSKRARTQTQNPVPRGPRPVRMAVRVSPFQRDVTLRPT